MAQSVLHSIILHCNFSISLPSQVAKREAAVQSTLNFGSACEGGLGPTTYLSLGKDETTNLSVCRGLYIKYTYDTVPRLP